MNCGDIEEDHGQMEVETAFYLLRLKLNPVLPTVEYLSVSVFCLSKHELWCEPPWSPHAPPPQVRERGLWRGHQENNWTIKIGAEGGGGSYYHRGCLN